MPVFRRRAHRRSGRVKRSLRWLWQHPKSTIAGLLVILFCAVNVAAYLHASAMLQFAPAGTKTPRPEDLSLLGKARVLLCGVTVPRPVNQRTPEDLGLAYRTERFVSNDGMALDAWYVGCRAPKGIVILLHGYASCKSDLLDEAQAFHELGYETLVVDFRGSGESAGDQTSLGIHEARDVEAALRKAREIKQGRKVVLYGRSMGAAASLRAIAVEDARPDAVILESPFNRLIDTVANRFNLMGLPAFPLAHLLVYWGGVRAGDNGFRHNPEQYAAAIDLPALVLHGELDRRVTKQQSGAVHQALTGTKRFILIPNADHNGCFRSDPDAWKQTISRFLADVP